MTENILRDDRAESFRQIGDLVTLIAERHCHVPVDELTHERWRESLALLREVDTIADDTDMEPGQVLHMLETFDMFADSYPSLRPGALPDDDRLRLVRRVGEILDVGRQLSETTDIDEFISLRVLEGELSAQQLVETATPTTREHPNFMSRFIPAMGSLSVTACLWDSMSDARRDKREGKIKIDLSRNFYTQLGTESLHHAKEGFQALGHAAIAYQFGVMSVTRLKNRLTHGITPYSSANNYR